MLNEVNNYTVKEILEAYQHVPEGTMVYVGTDSTTSKYRTTFITVVVFHYGAKSAEGGKGCKVFPFVQGEPKIKSINQKLLKETHIAMGYAIELMYGLPDEGIAGIPTENMEIHSDYNPSTKHKSHAVVQEARSYVLGQGLVHRIKPDSVAATGMADHIGRNLGIIKDRTYVN